VSAQPGDVGRPLDDACPLCGRPVTGADQRCRECGMTLAGRPGRAQAFTRPAFWWTSLGLLLIYLVVLGIVAVVR
jgi:predicted nucleic acid-binding Zn ribbon protein